LRVFERSLLIKKRLHYNSITVLSFYLLPLKDSNLGPSD
jgi:hypothetical protein